jgi:hypothetical protein
MARLQTRIRDQSPGPHQYVEHHDAQHPWCDACGYTDTGLHRSEYGWTSDDEDLLTVAEVAKLAGLDKETLKQLRVRGQGPPSVRRSEWRWYRRAAVDAWLETQHPVRR